MQSSSISQTSNPVRVLSQDVIHRIAAGEVVDRPSSVIKELVENSVDAGASDIKITLIEGGLKAIIVEDNGAGMSEADLALCLQRHATSKIQNVDDLDHLFSLGFRGEALAAISSVSEIEIHTKRNGAEPWSLKSRGGVQTYLGPGSQKEGTRVEVKDLFYNVPARKKFIKSVSSEVRSCVDVLEHLALCFPQVSFSWFILKDQTGDLLEDISLPAEPLKFRVSKVVGVLSEPYHVNLENNLPDGVESLELVFWGPPHFFSTQKHITLCVNGRAVFDKRLGYSLREAYHGVIPVGQFPAVHVNLKVNPEVIDANIHPQKKELRWPKGFSLAGLIYKHVRPFFDVQSRPVAQSAADQLNLNEVGFFDNHDTTHSLLSFLEPASTHKTESFVNSEYQANQSYPLRPNLNADAIKTQAFLAEPSDTFFKSEQKTLSKGFFSSMRVVGEVGAKWILLESSAGMVVVDQHAAHERVNFEKILTSRELIRSAPLLTPFNYRLPSFLRDAEVRSQLMNTLEEFGFEFNRQDTVSITELEIIAVPVADRQLKWSQWLEEIVDSAQRDQEVLGLLDRIRTHVAASLACHSSVRFGQRLKNEQISSLLEEMDAVQWGRYCPHGRPVYFELSHEELAKRFDR